MLGNPWFNLLAVIFLSKKYTCILAALIERENGFKLNCVGVCNRLGFVPIGALNMYFIFLFFFRKSSTRWRWLSSHVCLLFISNMIKVIAWCLWCQWVTHGSIFQNFLFFTKTFCIYCISRGEQFQSEFTSYCICNWYVLVPIKTVNMYLIVVFNSGHDGYARGGGEYVLIRVPNYWGRSYDMVLVGNPWFNTL